MEGNYPPGYREPQDEWPEPSLRDQIGVFINSVRHDADILRGGNAAAIVMADSLRIAADDMERALKTFEATLGDAGVAVSLPSIEEDEGGVVGRHYIPVHPDWEVQTRGNGSSFRIAHKPTGDRWIIMDGGGVHKMLERMARDIHAFGNNAQRIAEAMKETADGPASDGFPDAKLARYGHALPPEDKKL